MKVKKLMKGNEAIAEAAIACGCQCYFGYPITPQNELINHMSVRMLEENRVFIQSESELAAINMVFGASACGVRAMTSSSSPGVSLMQEGISYLAGAELPAVIINVTRGGPGLGNISAAQSDYFQSTRGGGHGDYRTITLAPDSVQEMIDFTVLAFDLADKYRNPVLILSDAVVGQMYEPVIIEEQYSINKYDKSWALTGAQGREPNLIRSLYMEPGALERHNRRLKEKYDIIEKKEILFEEYGAPDGDIDILIVAFGISARISTGAVDALNQAGVKSALFRPRTLWPFPYEQLRSISSRADKIMVVEMNSGQMIDDVKIATKRDDLHFYGYPGGGLPFQEELRDIALSLAGREA